MRLLVINPNSTEAMTKTIAGQAAAVARSDTQIRAVNPTDAPPAIQGREDGFAALPGLFAVFDREIVEWSPDAVIIACFDDTGLAELKRRAPVPVLGIGEAAFHAAILLGGRFSVVTTLDVSVPVIEENIASYGFAERCAMVHASGVPVLDLEDARDSATETIAAGIENALAENAPDAIVLGCAGMAGLADRMTERFHRPVIDGVTAAVVLAEALHALRKAGAMQAADGRHII